ncbi:MAG: endolytic transglycosylase MltG [Armatimonadota bacterium]
MLRRQSRLERLRASVLDVLRGSWRYLAALAAFLAVTAILLYAASLPPTGGTDEVIVRIPQGATDRQVASILHQHRLIRSRTAFGIIRHIGYEGRPFIPGVYRIRQDTRLFTILDRLVNGDIATQKVTIPEGFTIRQIARRLDEHQVTDAAVFLDLASSGASRFGIETPTGSLEGYLFPDTYFLPFDTSAEQVIRRMLDNLERRVVRPHGKEIRRSGRTLHEILTIASLIEREARLPEDRPLIASVIENRLRLGMPLQIDATILYAQGQHKSRVLYRDLDVESDYNTYRNRGLPPGPIANPGLACIEAALRPAQTDYLYYVAAPDGSHLFAVTFEEHRANIRKVRGR